VANLIRMIPEPNKTVDVIRECDVVVIGFGRNPRKMAPIQTPRFYAAEFVPAFTNTQGGPRRNSNS
jgi:hypothetical protein